MADRQVVHGCPEIVLGLGPLIELMFHVERHECEVGRVLHFVLVELVKTESLLFESAHEADATSCHFYEPQFEPDLPNHPDEGCLGG